MNKLLEPVEKLAAYLINHPVSVEVIREDQYVVEFKVVAQK